MNNQLQMHIELRVCFQKARNLNEILVYQTLKWLVLCMNNRIKTTNNKHLLFKNNNYL